MAEGISWQSWAPPLAPPAAGGLPADQAEAIAAAWWDTDPHLAAAIMWETYAATLQQEPAVQSVHTGMQSVAYYPAAPGGEFGLAIARAEWHRSFGGTLRSAPLRSATRAEPRWYGHPGWWVVDE